MPDLSGPHLDEGVEEHNSSPTLKDREPSDRYGV